MGEQLWNVFAQTGDPIAYLMYKEAREDKKQRGNDERSNKRPSNSGNTVW